MIIQPTTDLTSFAGARVVINHTRTAHITAIRHGTDSPYRDLNNGVCGDCVEDPHGDCRGGDTAFWWPYGTDLTLEETK